MALAGWVETEQVVMDWGDAPDDDAQLRDLLMAAYYQCLAYAPPVVEVMPEGQAAAFGMAQTLQAQHLWARRKAGNGEGYGAEGYMIQTYPLVMESRQLMRPKRSPLAGLL